MTDTSKCQSFSIELAVIQMIGDVTANHRIADTVALFCMSISLQMIGLGENIVQVESSADVLEKCSCNVTVLVGDKVFSRAVH